LKNVEPILKELSTARIEVVSHGEGISLLTKKHAKHSDAIKILMKKEVKFVACENTLKKKSLSKDNLIEGTSSVPSGAVEVFQKQAEGYGYFKP
jgi:uncharacterized protein